MARTKQTARKSFPGGDAPRKQLVGVKKRRRKPRRTARPPEPWEHPEASWEAHRRRREESYTVEMEHAFTNWYGVALGDQEDFDGTPFYDPPDPDPDCPGWEKCWRPKHEVQRLLELCASGPARDTAQQNFTDFLNDHYENEYNLKHGRKALSLKQSFLALPESDARNRIIWVVDHCLEEREGSIN